MLADLLADALEFPGRQCGDEAFGGSAATGLRNEDTPLRDQDRSESGELETDGGGG